jgi:hypothetical protein
MARSAVIQCLDFINKDHSTTRPCRGVGVQGVTLGIGAGRSAAHETCYFSVNERFPTGVIFMRFDPKMSRISSSSFPVLINSKRLDLAPLTSAHLCSTEIRGVLHCPKVIDCDCERIWSVDPAPDRLRRKQVRELINTVRSNTQLTPNQYLWTNEEYIRARMGADMQVLPGRSDLWLPESYPFAHVRLWHWPGGF